MKFKVSVPLNPFPFPSPLFNYVRVSGHSVATC